METKKITTRCCIVGGGPAGIMLGFLLAKGGIEVVVLEKWADFFRDFRGDTIHPSTMQILYELNLLDEFLTIPHNQTQHLEADIGTHKVLIGDFSQLNVRCPYIAFVPQWDFLKFIVKHAKQYPNFHLMMNTEATDLIEAGENVIGLRAKNSENELEIYAELVIGADGRHSTVRAKSLLVSQDLSAPMDVLWFRLSRKESDPKQSLGKIDLGRIIIMIERDSYWQCGYLIRKGEYDKIRSAGLESFQNDITQVAPSMSDRVHELKTWDDIKLLEVKIDRLNKWYRPGLLCIGDAAHAMSPIGGVGINLAIQDAVASANVLVPAFLQRKILTSDLEAVQTRRQLPTKIIQRIQIFLQNKIIARVLGNPIHPSLPLPFKLFQWFPFLRRIPAHLIGLGFRPEHVEFLKRIDK